jgi:hypothetical protein
MKKQADQGIPFNEAENAEHLKQALTGLEKNQSVAPPPDGRSLITWERYGIAQTVQPESVQQITERYFSLLRSGSVTPAAAPFVQHMMDLEAQAAMANAQRPAIPAVRDTVNSLVNTFLSEWLAANKK